MPTTTDPDHFTTLFIHSCALFRDQHHPRDLSGCHRPTAAHFLQELEIETWLIIYLLVIGLIKLSFHGLAFISFGKRLREIRLWFAWLAFITNVTSYWLEYFFLWHKDQRAQMPLFTLGTQVLGFALLAYYTIQKQKWEPFDGFRN